MTKYVSSLVAAAVASIALSASVRAVDAPDIVYLNNCAATCPVSPGTDDAVNGKTSLISSAYVAAAFPYSDSVFDATAACVRHLLASYNIQVRVTTPGSIARREIMITTTGGTIGKDSGLTQLAPFNGSPRENTIGFVFASTIGSDVDNLCWVTALTIGNLYGLEQVTPCPEIMSYGTGCGEKSFLDQDSACDGTESGTPGKCFLGNTTQNSDEVLLSVPGPRDTVFENGLENFQLPSAGPSP